MQTSSRFAINYPSADRSDTADVPRDFISVVTALDANAAMFGQGTLAARPTSTGGSPGKQGRFYMATDQTPMVLYYDYGTGWSSVGSISAGSIGTTQLADGAVTTVKLADGSVTGGPAGAGVKIAATTITHDNVVAGTIRATELAAALQPSQGAGASTEALRALGTAAGQALGAANLPSVNLIGTLAARPAAASGNNGFTYLATDQNGGTSYESNGTTWLQRGASVTVPAAQIGSDVPVVPVGAMLDWPWAAASIPAWTALPYGQLLTNAANPALQAIADAAGRPYGGVAGTNFNMPDFRGRIGVGKDDMGGTAANRVTLAISGITGTTLGAVGGSEGITLTTAQLPAHTHTFTSGVDSVDHTHTLTTGTESADHTHGVPMHQNTGAAGGIPTGYNFASTFNETTTGRSAAHTHSGTSSGRSATHTHSGTTDSQGSGSAHPNVQPTIIVNKIMRIT